tara:strand:- start:647 stop:1327 length:681 start_codon:yes stop_codon:yes gene_type:complete
MTRTHSPRIVTDGLVLALDAGNTKSYPGSGTSWSDISGQGNNGTLTNGPTYSSDNGGSIVFDGTNDYIDVSGTESFNAPLSINFTLSIWMYPTKTGNWQGVFTKNRSTGTQVGLFLSSSNEFVFGFSGSGGNLIGSSFSTNTWYHVVLVQAANTSRKIYINGSLDVTKTSTFGTTSSGSETFRLGQASGVNEYFGGRISNASIYNNKALTASEVLQNYNALKGRYQ